MLSLEGERKVEVWANSRFNERLAVFSPDGRWVAYQSDESGRYEIYVQAFRGRGARRQISTKGGELPRWSRDGRQLFYRIDQLLMSAAVRIDGDELQVGVPQKVVETDGSSCLGLGCRSRRKALCADTRRGGRRFGWSNPGEIHLPLVRGTQAPRSQEMTKVAVEKMLIRTHKNRRRKGRQVKHPERL